MAVVHTEIYARISRNEDKFHNLLSPALLIKS